MAPSAVPEATPYATLKTYLRAQLTQLVEEKAWRDRPPTPQDRQQLHQRILGIAERSLRAQWRTVISPAQQEQLIEELVDEIVGLGPLEPLIKDASITEIMVNGPHEIFVERSGKIERLQASFANREHLLHFIERILSPLGRRVNESEPCMDARLTDGSRMNVVIAPMALDGPYVTIRKFAREPITLEDLVRQGTLTSAVAAFLKAAVTARCNIVLSGASGVGKTTTLNALAHLIPPQERVVVMEDTAELQFRDHHVVRLETRPPSLTGMAEVTMRDLLKNALHMRPDRIIVGEVRGEEALEMLQAMNTGHDGCMVTVHANTPADVLPRIETMALMMRLDLSAGAIRRQIVSAMDLIVHLERFSDGSRKVVSVVEVAKDTEGVGKDALRELFTFHGNTVDAAGRTQGRILPTGLRPQPDLLARFERSQVALPSAVFE